MPNEFANANFVIEGCVDPREPLRKAGAFNLLDHATSEIASGGKLGIDATKKLPRVAFKRPLPPLIKMDALVKAKVEKNFNAQ